MVKSKIRVFDSLVSDYDAWFEKEGRLIFASEVEALRQVLPLLPEPWIEVGVGSGRFAKALGTDIGLDPSCKLLEMARCRGVSVFLGRGEEMPFKKCTDKKEAIPYKRDFLRFEDAVQDLTTTKKEESKED